MAADNESSELDAFGDLTVPVEVRIGKCLMKVQELAALQLNSTIPLDRPAGETMDLMVGNLRLAMVEVVANEDRMAVITELFLPELRKGAAPPAALPSLRRGRESPAQRDEGPNPSQSGRIADLELTVHAILGRTSILLRDVFHLMAGSTIDLPTTVADPVDIVVNDRVIAHGQVVTFNGSYGVRLTHQLTAPGGESCRRRN